ncbi:hypothetical protein GCM10011403_24530 [Pseudohongiella nitratireducens]|uniref:DUF2007 domain-containing protein n=1 Tax=Pseudohongiella nitratireducens TaxID=1768907 RepID=A0A916QMJ3_9GAMM|nr:DUF6164 family protein [Pseudohongiella nitratireducens]MDF1622334.1 DUF6164 family protein [Pseudohongiella nitratireducens]GFZ80373.1 hypothetical protein GCM10011403_24530 [Pseudohongiella nitratireducens]|tara:strand:+ start:2077 stop:2430 length:354 start_codon:yes stop_codon:yes gene_type:complete
MARLLFRLRNVPDDEAEDVRQLLIENEVDFYETKPGNWGISMPGLWLHHDDDFAKANALLQAYQHERQIRVRAEYQQAKESGEAETQWQRFQSEPLKVTVCIAAAIFLVYISVTLFF